jgi:hypothetical protein
VIDTIAVDMTIIGADLRKLVPIGGIAHAGARGISKVEVQMDGGPWHQADLRTPLSKLTWVIWRYDWPYQSGKHTFTVRCCMKETGRRRSCPPARRSRTGHGPVQQVDDVVKELRIAQALARDYQIVRDLRRSAA